MEVQSTSKAEAPDISMADATPPLQVGCLKTSSLAQPPHCAVFPGWSLSDSAYSARPCQLPKGMWVQLVSFSHAHCCIVFNDQGFESQDMEDDDDEYWKSKVGNPSNICAKVLKPYLLEAIREAYAQLPDRQCSHEEVGPSS